MRILDKFKVGYWNVGVIEKSITSIMNDEAYTIRWMKHRYKDRFFADPFLYKNDEKNYYVLAEELIFSRRKGTIVLLTIDKRTMKLRKREEVVEDRYHLSYPNYEDGSILVENYRSGGVYRFKNVEGRVTKELVLDVPLIDPTFVKYQGKTWLFGTTKETESDPNRKLSIYVEKDGRFVTHKLNPVKIDINTARPGGKFFWYKQELYRPAQDCEQRYGAHINIMKVVKLSEEEYIEESVKVITSHESKRYNLGLHTFNVYEDFAIVDGFEYSIQVLQKIKNKLSKY